MRDYLLAIGIMTGNSLDGGDFVLTKFTIDGDITDLNSLFIEYPDALVHYLRKFRDEVSHANGIMKLAIDNFNKKEANNPSTIYQDLLSKNGSTVCFEDLESFYTEFLAEGVNKLIELSNKRYFNDPLPAVDIIGSHGQTCAHFPPSIAKTKDPSKVYTIQIGNGQKLADLTGIPVVYDFRSDDILNGGEGAPLAPVHHQHLASLTKRAGYFPLAFCNGGNTGNLSIISQDRGGIKTLGFDTGPFNHFPDLLMRSEKNLQCDQDGKIGQQGQVNIKLLELLYNKSVITKDGDNFLIKGPPKSSDPEWYKAPPELLGKLEVEGEILKFEDRIRTAEYFSAYIFYLSLSMIPSDIELPNKFALCGGGWNNPVIKEHFIGLLKGDRAFSPVLESHESIYQLIQERLMKVNSNLLIENSHYFGFDGKAMEARIFADAAVSRIRGEPFTYPETTGTSKPTICGIFAFPNNDSKKATPALNSWLSNFKTLKHSPSHAYSRASR